MRLFGIAAVVALACGAAVAEEPPKPAKAPKPPDVRLVHLHDGLRPALKDEDLTKVGDLEVGKLAAKVGIDLLRPPHPLVAHRFSDGRLFYVFFKTTENAFGDRGYVVQRIKKTERSWKTASDPTPVVKTTYLVEVFRTLAGEIKRPDQHHGSFSLGDSYRREVVKEYEVGIGAIPGTLDGTAWPYSDSLFRELQDYQEDVGLYDDVVFQSSRPWTLAVAMSQDGTYRVRSPELGLDLPKTAPDPAAARPRPNPSSQGITLIPGKGAAGKALVGSSTVDEVLRAFGTPLEDLAVGKGHRNLSFANGLTCNFDDQGALNTLFSRAGFGGRTEAGLSHASTRGAVIDAMGPPRGQKADATRWTYPGITFVFDGFERVQRIVITR